MLPESMARPNDATSDHCQQEAIRYTSKKVQMLPLLLLMVLRTPNNNAPQP